MQVRLNLEGLLINKRGDCKTKIDFPILVNLSMVMNGLRILQMYFWGEETEGSLMIDGEEDGKFNEEQFYFISSIYAKLGRFTAK